MKPQKTLEDILRDEAIRRVWKKLEEEIPGNDLKSVARHLVAIANRERFFGWNPPKPRQARRFAEHLRGDARKVERMNLYYGSELPLNAPAVSDLPRFLDQYAEALKLAAKSRKALRPPSDLIEREIAILNLLDPFESGRELYCFERAARLIQAAYDVAETARWVDAEQLRKLYKRQSLQYRLKARVKNPASRVEKK